MTRKIALIICTYMRPDAIKNLMHSVELQTTIPAEILVVDGSKDNGTMEAIKNSEFKIHNSKLSYYKVPPEHRGLTKQRNYGIELVSSDIEIVAFLDDDVILQPDYFEKLLQTYEIHPAAVGVGGYITNEVVWQRDKAVNPQDLNYFFFDGYRRKESSRYKLRRRLGLVQQTPPGVYPTFGHGRSISFLPPSGKTYQVNQLMGGVSSFPLSLLNEHKFSEYFEGYGLYEDAHFTLRVSKIGNLYVNTAAQLEHHHDPGGRPNLFNYGKMVVRNGWLVWRTFNPVPNCNDRYKWWTITILLAGIRFLNICTTRDRPGSFQEFSGRVIGMVSLLFKKPKN